MIDLVTLFKFDRERCQIIADNDVHREQLAARSFQVSNFKEKCCLEHYLCIFKLNINN